MAGAKLQFWALPHCGFETVPILHSCLKDFKPGRPGAEVEVSIRTSSSLWKYLVMLLKRPERLLSSEPRPDIIQIPSHWTATLAHLGLLEDLSEIEPVSLDPWVQLLRNHCVLSGTSRVFSLPWYMEVWVLYYRIDLLKKARIDPEKSLRTWEGLAECCRLLSRRRRSGRRFYPIANSNPKETVSLADVASSIWSRGGDFFASDGSRSLFHRTEALEGIRAYIDFLAKGWMPLLGKSGLIPENLFDGHCALQFSGRFPRNIATRFRRALRTLPSPQGSGGGTGTVTAYHLALVRDSPLKKEAYELLRCLTDAETAPRYSARIGAFPATENWASSAFAEADPLGGAFRKTFESARGLPNLPVMATLEQIFDRSMERLVRDILRRNYREETLHQEMLYTAAEMDYVLTLNG